MPEPPATLPEGDILFTWGSCSQKLTPALIASGGFRTRILWSIDDPNWSAQQTRQSIACAHDIVLSSCVGSLPHYRKLGVKRAYFCPPAIDTEHFHPGLPYSEEHSALVSFMITNLYPKRIWAGAQLDRRELIEGMRPICLEAGFKLWGPPALQHLPGYQRFIPWAETALVHANTDINLNTNFTCGYDLYFNERFFCIAGTSRAQLLERSAGYERLFKDGVDVIYASSIPEAQDKIRLYLREPGLLDDIGCSLYEKLRGWTYDTLVELVMDAIAGKDPRPAWSVRA